MSLIRKIVTPKGDVKRSPWEGKDGERRPGYTCSVKSISSAFSSRMVRNLVVSFAGPISGYSLSLVLYFQYSWLYSPIEGRWYPGICDGKGKSRRNVFARHGLISPSKNVHQSDEKLSDGVPRSCCSIFYIVRNLRYINESPDPYDEEQDSDEEGEEPSTHHMYSYFRIPYVSHNLYDIYGSWHVEDPNEKSIILDQRERERSEAWRERILEYEEGEKIPPLETATHFFDHRLIPIDVGKLLYVSQGDGNGTVASANSFIEREVEGYSPEFAMWLWMETGGSKFLSQPHKTVGTYPVMHFLSPSYSIPSTPIYNPRIDSTYPLPGERNSYGWTTSARRERVVHDDKILPLDVAIWSRGQYGILREYKMYVDSLSDDEEPNPRVFYGRCKFFDLYLPCWYLIDIGAIDIEEVEPAMMRVVDAINYGKLDYVELFLKRGFFKGDDIHSAVHNGMRMTLSIFKLLERYVDIPYESLEIRGINTTGVFNAYSSDTYIDGYLLQAASGIRTETYMQSFGRNHYEGEGRERWIGIPADVIDYIVESKGVDILLSPLGKDEKSNKYLQDSVRSRISYLVSLTRSYSSGNPTVSQRAILGELVNTLLLYGDSSRMKIDKPIRWIMDICDNLSILSGIKSDHMKLSSVLYGFSGTPAGEIMRMAGEKCLWDIHPAEILSLFIKGWNSQRWGDERVVEVD